MTNFLEKFLTTVKESTSQLKQYLETKLPVLHHQVKQNYTRLNTRLLGWHQEFKQADKPRRWQMVKRPVLAALALFLLIKFGPLFTPPRIMTSFPGNLSFEAPLDSKIEIIFNKGVIKSLTQRSFGSEPDISGNFSWESNQKLIFTPKNKLSRATGYKISFRGIVLSNFFMPLVGNKTIRFETIGNPKVVLASPQNEALEDLTPITAVFDRPMIALTTATNSAIKKPAFSLNPEIEGEGRWLGTTAYQYRPSEPFRKATTYRVTVPMLQSQDEGHLQNEYRWEFSSQRPRVEAVSPLHNEQFASPTASVSAMFSQNLKESSISEKFHLFDASGNRVPGRVTLNGRVFGFYPSTPLIREKSYRAQIDKGVQSREGPNGMETSYTWSFNVAPKPQVISTTPKNGDKNISEENSLQVFFRTPMDEGSFESNVFIDPQPETKPNFYFSSYENKNTLSIGTYLGRSKTYTITMGSGVKDQHGVALDASYKFSFSTAPYKPSVNVFPQGTYFGSFNQNVIPRIVAQVVNANRVDYSLYKLKREDFLDLYRRRYENECGSNNYGCQNWQSYEAGKLEKIRSWSETYEADLNTPVHVVTKVTTDGGDNLPAGFYFLDLRLPQGAHDNIVMVVSKSTLTVKKSDKQIFSWAVNQSSNEVVSNMNIQLTNSSGNVLSQGMTNDDGVFIKDIDLFQKNNLFVFGQKDDDTVVAADIWNQGIDRSDFGLPSYYDPNQYKEYDVKEIYKLFLTLDRPIYRPGQKVYFKGVIRKDNDGAYENVLPREKISVTINDAQNRSVSMQTLPITSFGSFSGEIILSKDANLGYYQIGATFQGNTFNQQFQVEEYKRPDLAVTVKPAKDTYIQGENATIAINSSYYFGSPVADAPVTWTLQTQDYSFQWDKDWRFEFGDPDSYWSRPWWDYSENSYFSGKKVSEGKGKTNEKGDLEINIPLDISQQKTSQRMIIEATVNDINNQSVAASQELIVHKAGLYAGLRPVSYANQSGKESQVEVVTVDMKGKEVPNVPVAIEFYKRTWETIREKNPDDGLFYYTSKPNDALVSSTTVTTDSLGRATASFTPSEGGTYKVVGKVTDKNGKQNISGSFLWVSGLGFSAARENNDRIVVVTDKRDYLVGENLSVFIASPYASDSAKTLLTAERGSVLDYKVVDTNNTSNNFAMSIVPKYSPNVFIGAVLVRGGDQVKKPAEFKIGYSEIKVTDKKQQVDVRISIDKKRYKPKETLRASIETKDLLGKPISTELAVGLVDKAVWDLASVELPDIYKTFYQPRNLEVETSQLLTISLDRVNANTDLGAKGGSGGGGEGGSDTSRRDFPETAYWNPTLKTDKDGKASLEIKLPDNLTTWRLAAIANSEGASFGSKVSEVTVSRDVLIRPFLPRFLSVGDQARLGAIIVNTSGEDQTIIAKIEAEGIQITDEKTKQQSLADGAQTKITWSTTANNAKFTKIRLSVEGNNVLLKDAVEMTLPIKSYSIPEVVATSGEAKDSAQEKIILPKEVDAKQGQASIAFSPSLGGASLNALPYLFNYPYYCTEQITSRFMPTVFVHRVLKNAKIDKTGSLDSKQLEQVIVDGTQRLNNQQHPDGGWGWWLEDESDPFLTAYAFLGLVEAKKDKFTVAEQTLQKAQTYLVNQLARADKKLSLSTQAYILYVLRDRGIKLSSYAANLYERRFELSLESRAHLALAMKDISGMGDRAKRLHNELVSLAKKTATTTHWEEAKRDYYFMGSNTTTTASVLEALVAFDKKNPLIPEVIRYLMSIRTDDHWDSTRETAAVIKAISSQLLKRGDQRVDENYRLALNGKILKEGKFSQDDLLKLEQYVISINQLKIGEENKLEVSKSGQGNLYYDINLKYYLPFSEIKALEQGMVIVREFVDSQGKLFPLDTISENTEVWIRLIIVAPEERHFVVIEDILPAGLESVNESLKNVSILNKEKPSLKEEGNQLFYFSHKEYHDDRTTLFADHLPPGVYEVTYRARATTPGRYHHPPAQAYQMYIPDVSGHSAGGWLEVK